MADDGPRLTRSTSKRNSGDMDASDEKPPPMKSGLTEIFGSASIDKSEPPEVKRPRALTGGLNDKSQQKKWANKRDEIRARRNTGASEASGKLDSSRSSKLESARGSEKLDTAAK
jgi:hypothetical protein